MEKAYIGTKTALVFDYGLFVSVAERLARDFKKVYYYNPSSKTVFPKFIDAQIGAGLQSQNVERIENFSDYIDEVDLFYFPDTMDGDLQFDLRAKGKRVWGSGKGEELELYRGEAIENLKKLGLPTPTYKEVKGLDKLREYLKAHDDVFVKVDIYRGTFETFNAITYELTEPLLDKLEKDLGPSKNLLVFLVFDKIDGVELAFDGYTVDGQYPKKVPLGYEIKDIGWIAHVKDYDDLFPAVKDFNAKIAPTLKANQYRNFFSPEMRITDNGTGYMTDACCRHPSPVAEVYFELIKNFSEIAWYGAEGVLVEPEFAADYAMTLTIESDWAEHNWQKVYYPKEISRWVKLRNYTIIDGDYCIVPTPDGSTTIGVIVTIGDSLEDCAGKINKIADQIKGYRLRIEMAVVDKMQEVIDKGEAIGIKF